MRMPPTNDLFGALFFGLLFSMVLIMAEAIRRRKLAGAETTRKIVHVGGGLLSLGLPWLVRSPAVVLAMSVGLALLFLMAQRLERLHSLHDVTRRTRGTVYFPPAVFMVYLVAYDQYWLYVCALLVLAVADTFAALIGTAYGRLRYEIEDESKSVEGSFVFLLIAFLALHLPMLLMTDLPREVCVLAALLVAILVTGFEAVSMGGADNLFIPLGVAVILGKITTKPLSEIVYQNLSLLAVSGIVLIAARRARSFNAGGTIMFALFSYGAWSLGSERWALPILSGFFGYTITRIMFSNPAQREKSQIRTRILFRALVIPLLLLVTGNMFRQGAFFFAPFAVTLSVVLMFGLWSHILWALSPTGISRRLLPLPLALLAWLSVSIPLWLWLPWRPDGLSALAGFAVITVAAAIDDVLLGANPSFDGDRIWPASRMGLTLATASAMIILQAFNIIEIWPS